MIGLIIFEGMVSYDDIVAGTGVHGHSKGKKKVGNV